MIKRKNNVGIFLKSLLASWVTIIFGTSILIYLFSGTNKIYHENHLMNILRNIWEIGDEMGPAVKISIIIIFGLFVYISNKKLRNRFMYVTSIFSAIIAIFLVLAFLPESFSRGYGIGISDTRFDNRMIPIYAFGAFFGGIAFTFTYKNLLKKELKSSKQ